MKHVHTRQFESIWVTIAQLRQKLDFQLNPKLNRDEHESELFNFTNHYKTTIYTTHEKKSAKS